MRAQVTPLRTNINPASLPGPSRLAQILALLPGQVTGDGRRQAPPGRLAASTRAHASPRRRRASGPRGRAVLGPCSEASLPATSQTPAPQSTSPCARPPGQGRSSKHARSESTPSEPEPSNRTTARAGAAQAVSRRGCEGAPPHARRPPYEVGRHDTSDVGEGHHIDRTGPQTCGERDAAQRSTLRPPIAPRTMSSPSALGVFWAHVEHS